MKKILGVVLGVAVLAAVGVVGAFALAGPATEATTNPVTLAANDAKNSVTNAAIDASGIKTKVQDTLDANISTIAAATGLSTEEVNAAVANLNIENWEAASLPANATASSTIEGKYAGVDGTITTYDDAGYVTVEAYGQTVTLAVPDSAQAYLPYLSYLQ